MSVLKINHVMSMLLAPTQMVHLSVYVMKVSLAMAILAMVRDTTINL